MTRKNKGGTRKIIGLGKVDSGIPDLASNKAHMEGFGRDSVPPTAAAPKTLRSSRVRSEKRGRAR